MDTTALHPAPQPERHLILDALRGIALLGICLANYPEFSLYTFQKAEVIAAMHSAGIDQIARFLLYTFIDGKFYSIFSLLFGIGFSIMMTNAEQRGNGSTVFFYRRLTVLAIIGLAHLMLLWSGDILLLYALTGMLLPLFRRLSNRILLIFSVVLILCPVAMDAAKEATSGLLDPAGWLPPVIGAVHSFSGINDNNFGTWLVDGRSYGDILHFTLGGAFIRMQELMGGHRFFKVLGLFLLGLYIGRNRLYADLTSHKALFIRVALIGFAIGLPASCLYAWNAMNAHPLGITGSAVIYAVSVVPMALAYASGLCLLYSAGHCLPVFKVLAAPGRMALTNYIGQSVIGMMLFYGVGFGLGASMGLAHVECIALAVFLFQTAFSIAWMRPFRFGPLEWIWRMLTYGTFLNPVKLLHFSKHNIPT